MTDPPRQHAAARNELRLVFWETTAACNLACRHCRRLDVASAVSSQDLTTEQARAMMQAIRFDVPAGTSRCSNGRSVDPDRARRRG